MPAAATPRSDEASSSCNTSLIRPSGVDWTVGGKLAKFGGDLKGNPFQALVDLIPHEDLKMKHDISAQGIAEQMVYFQFFASTLLLSFLLLFFMFLLNKFSFCYRAL